MPTTMVPLSPTAKFLSLRMNRRGSALVELALVIGVLELGMWEVCGSLDLVFRVMSLPLVALVVWRSHRRRAVAQTIGSFAARDTLAQAWGKSASATAGLALLIPLLAIILRMEGDGFRWFWLEKGTRGLVSYLAEKGSFILVQQLLLNYFLGPCCDELWPSRQSARCVAALLFGLVHLPSFVLAGITTLAAYCWLALFARGRRIAPLALSHLALAIFAHAELPERFTLNMRVGAPAHQIVERYRAATKLPFAASFNVLCSDRYYAACGATGDGFIRGLYRDMLGRPQAATDDEVAAWRKKLAAHARTDVVIEFFNSREFVENSQRDRDLAAKVLSERLAKTTDTSSNAWR